MSWEYETSVEDAGTAVIKGMTLPVTRLTIRRTRWIPNWRINSTTKVWEVGPDDITPISLTANENNAMLH